MNPAYAGRGTPGFYIPALCGFDQLPRFAIHRAEHPREGLRGYELVIWGTAAQSASAVLASFGRQAARAAVFKVGPMLARRFDQPPFSFFVLELPLRAACVRISVKDQRSGALRQIRRKPGVCRRARMNRPPRGVASIRQLLEAKGASARQAQEIVVLLSRRLSADEMRAWLSHPRKSHPVPDPDAAKRQADAGLEPSALHWTPVNAVSAGKAQLVIEEARRYVGG